ncbi:MAG: hypothetical protein EBV03_08090 [Proteobacteria bacterium]|nr:hypothetical protein [Pseudomonadota bacterium]
MDEDDETQLFQPSDDTLSRAFENLRKAILDVKKPMRWRHERVSDMGGIQAMTNEFMHAKASEQRRMYGGEKLYKDYPPINRWKKAPMRKRGFIDPLHSIEFQISERLGAFLTALQEGQLQGDEHKKVFAALWEVAGALDDRGVFLNQMRSYAAKTTLALEYDDSRRVSIPEPYTRKPPRDEVEQKTQRHCTLFFQRLNCEQPGKKNR